MDNHGYGLHFHNLCMCVFSINSRTSLIGFSASTASAYNLGFASMRRDLHCTEFQATVGLSVYALGFGVVPLITASFSEEFGRQPLYIGSAVGFLLMYMMVALFVPVRIPFSRPHLSNVGPREQVEKHPDRHYSTFPTRFIWVDGRYNGWGNYCRPMGTQRVSSSCFSVRR